MNEKLMAEYGRACVNLEIAQNKHLEIKKRVIAEINQSLEKPNED